MKTHLPVSLRKALLAALVTVTTLAYNKVHAAGQVNIQLPDPAQRTLQESFNLVKPLLTQNEVTVSIQDGSVPAATWSGFSDDKLDLSEQDVNEKVVSLVIESAYNGNRNLVKTGAASITAEAGVAGSGNTLETGGGTITVATLGGNNNSLFVNGEGDISIGAIDGNADRAAITTKGSLVIGTSDAAFLTNAQINATRGITIGDVTDSDKMIDIRGIQGDDGSTKIETAGDFVVNQSVRIQPGNGEHLVAGNVEIKADGKMEFLGKEVTIHGGDGNSATALVEAGGDIQFKNTMGTSVGDEACVKAKNGDISMESGNVASNVVGGKVDAAGKVDMKGGSNVIWGAGKQAAVVLAGSGISIVSEGAGNGLSNAAVATQAGGITMQSMRYNSVFDSCVKAEEGSITMSGGAATVSDSSVEAESGDVKITGTEVSVTNDTITASGAVTIAGTDVASPGTGIQDSVVTGDEVSVGDDATKTTIGTLDDSDDKKTKLISTGEDKHVEVFGSSVNISGDSVFESRQGNVSIKAAAGQTSIEGGMVTADEDVHISGTGGTTVDGVDVDGKTIAVGADGATVINNDSTLKASGNIAVKGASVEITYADIDSDTGNVCITVTAGTVIREAAQVKAEGGKVTINGGTTAVNTIEGASTQVTAANELDMDGAENTLRDGVSAQAGTKVTIDAARHNRIFGSQTLVQGGNNVQISAGTYNVVDAASVKTTMQGSVSLKALENNIVQNGALVNARGGDITLTSVGDAATVANTVTGNGTRLAAEADVKLDGESNTVTAGAHIRAVQNVCMNAADMNGATGEGTLVYAGKSVKMEGARNGITNNALVYGGGSVAISSTGTEAGNGNLISAGGKVTAVEADVVINAVQGNQISGNDTQVYAGNAVRLEAGKSNSVTATAKVAAASAVTLSAETANLVDAATVQTADGDVVMEASDYNVVQSGSEVTSGGAGSIRMDGGNTALNAVGGEGTALTAGADIKLSGGANRIYDSAILNSGRDVSLVASNANPEGDASNTVYEASVKAVGKVDMAGSTNTVANSMVSAETGSISVGDGNTGTAAAQNVIASGAGRTTTLIAGQDVTITGENIITSVEPGSTGIIAQNGDIALHEDNYIKLVEIAARGADGDVCITTGSGDKNTWIEDATITGETVTVAGDISDDRSDANLAVVKGENMLITTSGEGSGAGITLNNVSVLNTGRGANNLSAANAGYIVIKNRVDVENGTLTIESSASGEYAADGRILVDGDNVLNLKADSSLAGRLSGKGSINKSGGDELLLDRDHRDFTGTIYANGAVGGPAGSVVDADNAGSWIKVTDAGVGAAAGMVLKNTDLVIGTTETQIGSLDTTQDAVANEVETGGTLGADASYTADGNTRADFKLIGSVVEVNKGVSGDVVHAANLALSDATLLKLDATVDGEGNANSDIIAAAGTVDMSASSGLNSTSTAIAPRTARVFINHTDMTAAANAAEGARTTIMSGIMASDVNADVLYDVEESANGTYQRKLQGRNVHLEQQGDRVDLVFSKNYRSAAKDATMQTVADAIRQYSDAFHHSEGTLAAGSSQLEKLVDAFDYTRSEEAARRGLQSIAGGGNVLPQLMLFDSSRHHLNKLRKQMDMPVCPRTWKGAPNRRSNAWVTYTGASDSLDGDANLGDYTRSAHGAMLGVDTSVNCKTRVGLSLGYETSSGEADTARVDADTFFVDAYATAYTGCIRHRASIGIATSSFDSRRSVAVEAGYHSFHGTSRADTDALTLNIGYEISSDHKLNERSWLTRYAALNLAWHNLDDMREAGLDGVGLVTEYGREWQAGVALGLAYNREFAAVKYEAPAVFYANAAVHFELLADRATATNRFNTSSAGWQIESMEREPLYLELGAGVMVPLSPVWTATAGAAVEVGPARTSFSGSIGVRYSF